MVTASSALSTAMADMMLKDDVGCVCERSNELGERKRTRGSSKVSFELTTGRSRPGDHANYVTKISEKKHWLCG